MARKTSIFFIMLGLGIAIAHYLHWGHFDFSIHFKQTTSGSDENGSRRQLQTVETLEVERYIDNTGTRFGSTNAGQQKWLTPLYEIGGSDGFAFREVIAIAYDAAGHIYSLDYGAKRVDVFDNQGNHLKTIGRDEQGGILMPRPTDVTVSETGEVYVSDERQGILIFAKTGKLIRRIAVPYTIYQIALSPDKHVYALTPSEVYLLHKYDARGREQLAFARQPETDAGLRQVFGKAALAVDSKKNVYLSYVSPYRLIKYDRNGEPLIEFNRELPTLINPPTIHRDADGRVRSVARQEITFDLHCGDDGLLHNLVRSKGGRGGDVLDAFSTDGRYMLSLYLFFNARSFAVLANRIAFVSAQKPQKIAVYAIETGSAR